MEKEKVEYINAWILKAGNDLKSAFIILESDNNEKPFDSICFHCQQAVEKYLKAYLVYLDVMFTKTHNIGQLIELGAGLDGELRNYLMADTLTSYGVDIRYPDDFYIPTEEDTRKAYDIALEIKDFVRKKMKPFFSENKL